MAFLKIGVVEDAAAERDSGLDVFDYEFIEGVAHASHGAEPKVLLDGAGPHASHRGCAQ